MQFHPLCDLIPEMEQEQFLSLVEDIKLNGQLHAIITVRQEDGSIMILDGKHRFKACNLLKIEPHFEEWSGEGGSLLNYVLSVNLKRRHLSISQRAALSVSAGMILEQEARERQIRLAGRRKTSDLVEKVPQGEGVIGKTRDHLSELFGVNPRYIQDAKRISNANAVIFNKVLNGRITLTEAKEVIRLPVEQRQQVIEKLNDSTKRLADIKVEVVKESAGYAKPLTGKYQIILCDCPWQYDNFQGMGKRYGDVASLYNTMSLNELKALPVPAIIDEESCACFMWATYPKLPDAIELMQHWGFEYVTVAFTWVKLNRNGEGYYSGMGFYTNSNAEIVLLGKKGKILRVRNDVKQLVVTPVQEHSKKPNEIRNRIVDLLGDLPRVELFARQPAVGWDSWGNEV